MFILDASDVLVAAAMLLAVYLRDHANGRPRPPLPKPSDLVRLDRRIARYIWTIKSRHCKDGRLGPGRPRVSQEVREAVRRVRMDNPRYGKTRIAAILANQFGIHVSRTTVGRIIASLPDPPNSPADNWSGFIERHRDITAAMDFKEVDDLGFNKLFVLSIIDLDRRELRWCCATYHPTGAWLAQQLREAFPFEDVVTYMILDRDTRFEPARRVTLPNMGIEPKLIAYKTPQQNAFAERFIQTLSRELLDHVIPFNDIHLNRLLREYWRFYNTVRPHTANAGAPPVPEPDNDNLSHGPVRPVRWLGGLHVNYRRAAA